MWGVSTCKTWLLFHNFFQKNHLDYDALKGIQITGFSQLLFCNLNIKSFTASARGTAITESIPLYHILQKYSSWEQTCLVEYYTKGKPKTWCLQSLLEIFYNCNCTVNLAIYKQKEIWLPPMGTVNNSGRESLPFQTWQIYLYLTFTAYVLEYFLFAWMKQTNLLRKNDEELSSGSVS